MLPEILALDLDGTLLPPTKRLTPRAIDAVRAVVEAGVHVVLATGKSLHLTEHYARELALQAPLISLDGGLVRSAPGPAGGTLARVALGKEDAARALARLEGLPLSSFLADGSDRLVVDERLSDWEAFLEVYATRIERAASPVEEAEGDPFFLALLGSRGVVAEGEARLTPLAARGLSVFSAEFLERGVAILVVRPATDKGAALRRVAAHLGVERARVTAVGDWRNDVAMIRWAGTGVAMPRAAPDLLAAADVTLPEGPEADGVAKYLEALLAGARSAVATPPRRPGG